MILQLMWHSLWRVRLFLWACNVLRTGHLKVKTCLNHVMIRVILLCQIITQIFYKQKWSMSSDGGCVATHTLICLDPTCVQLKCLDIQLLFFSPPLLLSTDDTDPAICIEPWTVCVFKTPFINAWGFRLRRETAGVQQGERKLAN